MYNLNNNNIFFNNNIIINNIFYYYFTLSPLHSLLADGDVKWN